ncbi:MAG: hypothetical protein ACKUBY_01745 [Candidatus Moraniibacteriota bacterium]|jgi:hypothetical protein
MKKNWNSYIGKALPKRRPLGELWDNFTSTGKIFIVMFTFLIITSPVTIQVGQLVHYIVVHGEEIESFEPYTMEQYRKDFTKYTD